MRAQGEVGGIGKVQGLLYRLGLLKVSRGTVAKVLERQGHARKKMVKRRRNKPVQVRQFERAKPNDLWQTDIMTFMLRGQYRVYVIGFMDDNSRYIVGWGLFRRQTTTNVQEVFRAAIEKHGLPKEVLSDNGRQYSAWRGKSQFTKMLTKLGIQHIRSRPYHPQTCGKIESFWRNVWQECLSQVPVSSFEEAEAKLKEYVEHYNYKRPHQGIGNMMPADRFFRVDGQVRRMIEENTAEVGERRPPLGEYKAPTYLIGNIGGKELRVMAKDAQVTLREVEPEKVVESSEAAQEGTAGAPGEAQDGRTEESQAAEPGGADGVDPTGPGAESADPGTVPAGGGIEGTVLPVAETDSEGGAEGVGGGGAGPEGAGGGGPTSADPAPAGADSGAGEAEGKAEPGAGQPGACGGHGAADHQAQCLGTDGEGV
jgi:transposase InsO family protein